MPTMGVGVFIYRTDPVQILIGQRSFKCKRAPGCWAVPGGMCESGETLEATALREVREETGLQIKLDDCIDEFSFPVLGVSDHRPREDHLTFWMLAHCIGGEPVVREPDKHLLWRWVPPLWVFRHVKQEGEQVFWTPRAAWEAMFRNHHMI